MTKDGKANKIFSIAQPTGLTGAAFGFCGGYSLLTRNASYSTKQGDISSAVMEIAIRLYCQLQPFIHIRGGGATELY